MGIENISLQKDATAVAPTGGTALSFSPDGVTVQNGKHVAAVSVLDFRVRPSITFRTKNPTLTNGVFSKGKRYITLTWPKILADLSVTYSVVRFEMEFHPELTSAEVDNLIFMGSQLAGDADTKAFLTTGSLA